MRTLPRFILPRRKNPFDRTLFRKGYETYARYQEPSFRYQASSFWEDERIELTALTRRFLEEEKAPFTDLAQKGISEDSFRDVKKRLRDKFSVYRTRWSERFRGLLSNTATLVGSSVAGELGVTYSLYAPRMQELIDERSVLLADRVHTSTYRALLSTMEEGWRRGETVEQIAARVNSLYVRGYAAGRGSSRVAVQAVSVRARLFAQTETTAITNGAALRTVQGSNLPYRKIWETMGDDRVRPNHQVLAGESRGLTEKFSNGLQYPDEPGCRCSLRFREDK